VIIRTLDGGAERTLATAPIRELVANIAWSPDGKTIVTPVSQPGDQLSALAAIDVESGKRNLFGMSNDLYFGRPVWLPDGSGLLVLGTPAFSNQPQIVFISFPSGRVSPVTRDTNGYTDLSVAADGRTVATIERQTHQNPYVISDGGSSHAREFTIEGSPSDEISWTRDGQLLVTATNSGITLLNPASSAKTPMFSQFSYPDFAHACSDGRVIFMAAGAKIEAHLWRADADGGNPKELTTGKFDYQAVCSPDAKTVVYSNADNKLQKVGMDGGAPQPISEFAVFSRIAISPDGKVAAFVTSRPNDPKEKLVLQPLDSGQPPRFLDFERPRSEYGGHIEAAQIEFKRDGAGIIYTVRDGDTDNLWLQHLDGSPGKQLTDFKSEFIRDFDYSFDGKQLAVVRGHRESDVVLIRAQEK
jgi:Tol biopolymer transport system component